MHVLGISVGRKDGNSATLLKAALQAAAERSQARPGGVTVSTIHLPSASIPPNYKPLDGAFDITAGAVDPTAASKQDTAHIPDDRARILKAILDSDAIILGTPAHSRMPPGVLKAVTDSILGPLTDVAFAKFALDAKERGDERFAKVQVDARLLKPRVGGFIAVSGSPQHQPEQWSLVMPTLHQLFTPLHVKIVDQYLLHGYANAGAVLIDEAETIARARLLGERVASQLEMPFDTAQYLGPSVEGSCPYCHLLKIEFLVGNDVLCTVCGARGSLVAGADGNIRPVWEKDSSVSHITMAGKMKHAVELMSNPGHEKAKMAEIADRLEYWKNVPITPVLLSGDVDARGDPKL